MAKAPTPPWRKKPAAKAKSKPKSKRQASTKGRGGPAKRRRVPAIRLFNAAANVGRPMRVPGAIGSFVLQDTIQSGPVDVSANTKYLVFTWTPTWMRGFIAHNDFEEVGLISMDQIYNIRTECTGIRPLRATIQIRNTSRADAAAGLVRVVNTPEPLRLLFGNGGHLANFDTLGQHVASHADTKTYGVAQFRTTKFFNLYPASSTGYRAYHKFFMMDDGSGYNGVFSSQTASPAMNTLVLQFTQANDVQYEYTVHCQDAVHVTANGALHNQRQAPMYQDEAAHNNAVMMGQGAAGRACNMEV